MWFIENERSCKKRCLVERPQVARQGARKRSLSFLKRNPLQLAQNSVFVRKTSDLRAKDRTPEIYVKKKKNIEILSLAPAQRRSKKSSWMTEKTKNETEFYTLATA